MNCKKLQQRSNLSDTDPNISGTSHHQSSRDILNMYLQLGVLMDVAMDVAGHVVVFLTDLSHLWVPRCPDKRGKDAL